MYVIRAEQMQVFVQAQRQRFEDYCADLILNHWADRYAGQDVAQIRSELRQLLDAGSDWGFRTERQRYRLVNVAAYLGLGFQRQVGYVWAVKLLSDQSLAPEARIAAILYRNQPDGAQHA